MVHQNEYFGYDLTRFEQFDIGLGRITIFLSILNFHPKYPIFVESPGEDDWMKRCKWFFHFWDSLDIDLPLLHTLLGYSLPKK